MRHRKVEFTAPAPDSENASAFMAASMQGVIEKLRTQEKELARLHLVAQERAQESERLTEEVTRNMPTGLLLVNATGAISTTNPAAEEALGIRTLRYRSYKEILGADTALTRMLTACLRDGQTFHRGEVEHLTAEGEMRHLGVTISPIFRAVRNPPRPGTEFPGAPPEMKVSGALCLMSDLTELTALQKQIRWKENLAALGEMSAGIAHEFKNALATISGYAQMIRSEARPGRRHSRIGRAHSRPDARADARGHGIPAFRETARNLLRDGADENAGRAGGGRAAGSEPGLCRRMRRRFRGSARRRSIAPAGTRELDAQWRGSRPRIRRQAPALTVSGRSRNWADGSGSASAWRTMDRAFPQADLPKIFLPFYTTKSEGTGLGLAVVQKVALQHGGSIEARNRTGGGAEFLLWLPLRQEPSPSLFPSEAARI